MPMCLGETARLACSGGFSGEQHRAPKRCCSPTRVLRGWGGRPEQREAVTPPGEGVVKLASSFLAGRGARGKKKAQVARRSPAAKPAPRVRPVGRWRARRVGFPPTRACSSPNLDACRTDRVAPLSTCQQAGCSASILWRPLFQLAVMFRSTNARPDAWDTSHRADPHRRRRPTARAIRLGGFHRSGTYGNGAGLLYRNRARSRAPSPAGRY